MHRSFIEILLVSTKLGLSSFGGPVAHLGYFHNEYVRKRKWLVAILFFMLAYWKLTAWMIVLAAVIGGQLLSMI